MAFQYIIPVLPCSSKAISNEIVIIAQKEKCSDKEIIAIAAIKNSIIAIKDAIIWIQNAKIALKCAITAMKMQ